MLPLTLGWLGAQQRAHVLAWLPQRGLGKQARVKGKGLQIALQCRNDFNE